MECVYIMYSVFVVNVPMTCCLVECTANFDGVGSNPTDACVWEVSVTYQSSLDHMSNIWPEARFNNNNNNSVSAVSQSFLLAETFREKKQENINEYLQVNTPETQNTN